MKKTYLSRKKGFTLIEAVASIALLGILAVMILTAFLTQYKIIGMNSAAKQKDKKAQQALEKKISNEYESAAQTSTHDGVFTVDFNGHSVNTYGEYITGTDSDNANAYTYFKPFK